MMRFVLTLILSLILFGVKAQFNDSTTKYINLGSTGVINRTNDVRSYVLNNSLKFNIRRKDVSLNAGAGWIYGENNGKISNNDFLGTLDFNLFKTFEKFYYWGLSTYEKSTSLKINNRFQIGVGGAYNFVDNKTSFFNLSEGVMFENSDVMLNDTTRDVKNLVRNSFRIRYRFVIADMITLDGTHFVQNSLAEMKDYILKSNNSLSFRLYKQINFTTSLIYNKVNLTQRENMLITFGLTYDKYF